MNFRKQGVRKMHGKKVFSLKITLIMAFCIIFNLAAWKSAAFSDFYVTNIYPKITSVYGALTSKVAFSVGEIMLVFIVLGRSLADIGSMSPCR